MVKQYKIKLDKNSNERFSYLWAYQFYGILMEQIEREYGEQLHLQGQTPINQYITPIYGTQQGIWTINLFNDAIEIISKMLDNSSTNVIMRNHNIEFNMISREIINISESELIDQARRADKKNICKIEFITPTSFKTDGQYAIFPSVELIVNSLIRKWNELSQSVKIEDEDAINAIIQGVRISSYKLQTNAYHMKGISVPGFVGEVILKTKLALPLMEIFQLLMDFAPYSGIGIKTALGMGANKTK